MDDLHTLLERNVDTIYPSREFLEKRLVESKPLRVYLGVDATGDLQLHHCIPLFKLRHFQKLGHKIFLLIGSFTAMIGDPTGKTTTRVPLTKEQVLEYSRNYADLASKILDFTNNPPEVVYNGDWLEKLTFKEVVELASHFTVQQMIERDMFQKRLQGNLPIGLHEFLYPLMQGYDSVALNVDVEVGGTDQTFNMLAGRKLIENYLHKEKAVITNPLLTDSHGRKMSKSDGTGIPLNLTPNDLFGKIMSLPDDFIVNMMIMCTEWEMETINEVRSAIAKGENPLSYKKKLAFELTRRFHSENDAELAQENFESTVQHDELPVEIPEWIIEPGLYEITDLLLDTGLVTSKGEARRLVTQGGVTVLHDSDEKRIDDVHTLVEAKSGLIIKVGKRRFLQLKLDIK
jgi:tyrosyl-tRNA synthetase